MKKFPLPTTKISKIQVYPISDFNLLGVFYTTYFSALFSSYILTKYQNKYSSIVFD
jgi:hypothetical protein